MKYFLLFDYWDKDYNRFTYNIVDVDLTKTSLPQVCRDIIKQNDTDVDHNTCEIKVLSFNNVVIDNED